MNIIFDDDKYKIIWAGNIEQAGELDQWCLDSFGANWGKVNCGLPDRRGKVYAICEFYRLAHANWFTLKFDINQ